MNNAATIGIQGHLVQISFFFKHDDGVTTCDRATVGGLFIMVFSASGLVPILDLAFSIFISLYIFSLSHFTFPYPSPSSPSSNNANSCEIIQGSSTMFRAYGVVGTTVDLFLPLVYVLGGFTRGTTTPSTPPTHISSYSLFRYSSTTSSAGCHCSHPLSRRGLGHSSTKEREEMTTMGQEPGAGRLNGGGRGRAEEESREKRRASER